MNLNIESLKRTELIDITAKIKNAISRSGVEQGICMIYVPHTTAAVTINESADPDVRKDIVMFLNKLIPVDRSFKHSEGNSDAHIKASLVGSSEYVIIESGRPLLGTWQGIFFCEFDGPRTRKIHIKFINEKS